MGDETAPRLDPVSRGPAAGGSLPAAVTRGEGGAVRAHAVTSLDLPHTTTPESSRSGGGNYNQLKELTGEQDLHSRSLIGAGERRDGLFYFRRVPALHAVRVTGIPEFELWHRRLGHPSDRVLKLLPAISSSSFK
ncbi:unnamed protein product [Cuscuta epithymum]|uniref:GAG-pre-integrase domain-containing protein n=1 Tax=Cuscuta epithymum TaxID=186058 RepID=A0AAV0E2I2_9ASTE|nr:unnamed protein product [Cuscuta epithymum]